MNDSEGDDTGWGARYDGQSPRDQKNCGERGSGLPEKPPGGSSSDLNPFLAAAFALGGAAVVGGGAMALAKYMGSGNDYFTALSNQMEQFFKEHRQTTDTYKRKDRLKNDILSVTKAVFPGEFGLRLLSDKCVEH